MRSLSSNTNCAVKNTTNGFDYLEANPTSRVAERKKLQPIAEIIQDSSRATAVGLPQQYVPTIPPVAGSAGAIKSYILPDGKIGVVNNTLAIIFLPLLIKFLDVCKHLPHRQIRWVPARCRICCEGVHQRGCHQVDR